MVGQEDDMDDMDDPDRCRSRSLWDAPPRGARWRRNLVLALPVATLSGCGLLEDVFEDKDSSVGTLVDTGFSYSDGYVGTSPGTPTGPTRETGESGETGDTGQTAETGDTGTRTPTQTGDTGTTTYTYTGTAPGSSTTTSPPPAPRPLPKPNRSGR
jgi:hypothetical protein